MQYRVTLTLRGGQEIRTGIRALSGTDAIRRLRKLLPAVGFIMVERA